MNESLEKRKKDLTAYLTTEYSPGPQKWWHIKKPLYQTTAEAARRGRHYSPTLNDTIIRYDMKRALSGSALFLLIILASIFLNQGSPDFESGTLVFVIVSAAMMFVPILKEIKQRPKIIMNRDSIQLDILEAPVYWRDIAASYIKEEEEGESTAYWLVLHYYLESYDSFAVTEYKLQNLTVETADLAAEIEYRKLLASTKIQK